MVADSICPSMSDPYDPYDPYYDEPVPPFTPSYLHARRNTTSKAVGCMGAGCGCYTWPFVLILGLLFLGALLGLNDGKTISTFTLGLSFFGLLAFSVLLHTNLRKYMDRQLVRDEARWELEDQEQYEKEEKYRQQGRNDYYRKKNSQRKG